MVVRNIDIINSFVIGEGEAKSKNLYIDGNKLIYCGTILGEKVKMINGGIHFKVNATEYSRTTTRIQNTLLMALSNKDIKVFVGIPMGATSL
ncbi:hypothetical protein PQE75_gp066 [Bacillus phage vB_BcoS-136]|uniref:Uncharacterized protein n=1 Tax=Bacillus phage vB_BcoS-136 TaxID=2419619 RepID=A0A3G3BVD2_9CAUD|nr:hypothetical protein PQE75_gp066 [Bacillus phage vB_BcoS-136]AYP68198.1 hypothetical protein vBBcoS136_00066 [Bacillus phage vB_BcoS-136]